MRGILACLSVFAVAADAADWKDALQPKTPGSFRPLRDLMAEYSFGWSAFTAGYAEAQFTRKDGVNTLKTSGGSRGAPRALWRMDSTAVSEVDAATLLPIKLVQVEQYKDEKRKTTVKYGAQELERTREREPKDKDSGKTKKFKFAPVHDLHSALLFTRSQPLKAGEVLRFVVYPSADAYLAEVEVLGRENLKVAGQTWPAIKVALRLKRITKSLEVESHKKFKSAVGWISDDADRLLLKVETEVMVGKVWMEMQRVTFLAPAKK